MKDEDVDVEKLRMWLSKAMVEASGVEADLVAGAIEEALALLPAPHKPEPEVPPGPYTWRPSAVEGTWSIDAPTQRGLALTYCGEPTAKLLASSWTLRRRVDAAEELLLAARRNAQWAIDPRAQKAIRTMNSARLITEIDRYFKEHGRD